MLIIFHILRNVVPSGVCGNLLEVQCGKTGPAPEKLEFFEGYSEIRIGSDSRI